MPVVTHAECTEIGIQKAFVCGTRGSANNIHERGCNCLGLPLPGCPAVGGLLIIFIRGCRWGPAAS